MKEIILIKLGEIVLKGLNRQSFEFALIRNLRRRLEPVSYTHLDVYKRQKLYCFISSANSFKSA